MGQGGAGGEYQGGIGPSRTLNPSPVRKFEIKHDEIDGDELDCLSAVRHF
jgi:hypothetical protein